MQVIKDMVIRFINSNEALQKEIEKSDNAETIELLKRKIKINEDSINHLKIDYIERGGTEKEYMEFVNSLMNKQEQPKETPNKIEDVNIMDVIKEITNYEFYKFEDDTFKLLSQLYNVLKLEVVNLLNLKPSIEKNNKREYVDKLLKLFMEGMDKWTAANSGYNNKNWINNLYHAQLLCYLIKYDKAIDNFRKDILNYIHTYTYD